MGQHFLHDAEIARRIAESLTPGLVSHTLEVGPGTGILTQFLLENRQINLVAIEIDEESVEYLHSHFPQLNVIKGDFLKSDIESFFDEKFSIIGNFPYNISSQIFFKILEHKNQIPQVVCMLQKEVAERITSLPGKKAYGILSVFMQAFYSADYLFTVHEHVFDPPPKVKSAVVRFTRNEVQTLACDEKAFRTVVKTAFNQRRKTLRNSLKPLVGKDNSLLTESIFDKRPEQLNVEEFVVLTNKISTVSG